MNRTSRILGALAAPAALAAAIISGPAASASSASPASPIVTTFSTAEQAGYLAGGAQFRDVRTTFVLPDAGKFAGSVGAAGLSVQLWSPAGVHVLGISTCATATCQPGGTGVTEAWNGAVAVFDPTTHALLHSATNSPAMSAGDQITEEIFYNRITGFVDYTISDATAGTSFADTFHVGPSVSFTQARIGAEFGVDPWTTAPFIAPPAALHVITALGVRLTSYSGHRSGLRSWWTANRLVWTSNGLGSGTVQAKPHALFAGGREFTVSLQP